MKWTFARCVHEICGKKCCNCKSSAIIDRLVKLIMDPDPDLHQLLHLHLPLLKIVPARMDQLDHLDHLDVTGNLELLVDLENLVNQAKTEPSCLPHNQNNLAPNVQQARLVNLVNLALKDLPGDLAMLAHPVKMAKLANLVHLALLVQVVYLAILVIKDRLANRANC